MTMSLHYPASIDSHFIWTEATEEEGRKTLKDREPKRGKNGRMLLKGVKLIYFYFFLTLFHKLSAEDSLIETEFFGTRCQLYLHLMVREKKARMDEELTALRWYTQKKKKKWKIGKSWNWRVKFGAFTCKGEREPKKKRLKERKVVNKRRPPLSLHIVPRDLTFSSSPSAVCNGLSSSFCFPLLLF